jgi:hypothetical protein
VPARTVLAGVRRELREVQQQTRGVGWNLDVLARALAATRIAASYLSNHTVAQIEAAAPLGGQFAFGRGLIGRRRIAVSSSATAQAVHDNPAAPDLEDAMTTFTAARYSRADSYNNGALDDALAAAMRAADRAASQHTWIADLVRSVAQTMRGWAPRAWAR